MKTALAILALVSLCGCQNVAPVIKELKDDPACVRFDFLGYGTTIHFERLMPTNSYPVLSR